MKAIERNENLQLEPIVPPIPAFLRRQRYEDEMSDIPDTNEAPPPLPEDPTLTDQEQLLPQEAPPTFEELVALIRRLDNKIIELTEKKRILKKQADGMWRKM